MSGNAVHDASSPSTATVNEDSLGLVLKDVPCDSTVYVKAAVRMNGSGVAFNALADSKANSNVIGIVQAKSSSTLCDIRVTGVTPSIFTGLDETKEYFLSATVDGEITTTVPTGTGEVVLILGQPFSATRFMVNKTTRRVRS